MELGEVENICKSIHCNIFETTFKIRVERDNKRPDDGRIFIQLVYDAFCTNTGVLQEWHSRKWYLSHHMTEDEIVKTCYVAFESAVKHEVMEGFKINGTVLFNPHVDYKELLAISGSEVKRKQIS